MEVSLFNIWEYVLRGLQNCCKWIIDTLVSPIFSGIYNLISDYIPADVNIYLENLVDSSTYTLITQWFPVEYAITCFLAYISLAAIVYTINWILGLIPTVS